MGRRPITRRRSNGSVDHVEFASHFAQEVPGSSAMTARAIALAFCGWMKEQLIKNKTVTLHGVGRIRVIQRNNRPYRGQWRICGPRLKLDALGSMKALLLQFTKINEPVDAGASGFIPKPKPLPPGFQPNRPKQITSSSNGIPVSR